MNFEEPMNIESMNTEELSTASSLASQQPHPSASITIDESSITTQPPASMQLIPPCNIPKTDKDLDADNDGLGSTIVCQVMLTQSVDEKNSVLCDGIYNYFTTKYGKNEKCCSSGMPARKKLKSHNRRLKRVTREKNMARRELRAARREGRDECVIREVARKFHTLIRIHSKTKREQLKAQFKLEAGKARRECARCFWRFTAKILDDSDESPEPTFSAEEAEAFFKKAYSCSPREFKRPTWLPVMKPLQCGFNDVLITIVEISEVIKRSKSSSSPSPIDRVSYKIFKRCPALLPALVDLYNTCWESQTVPLAWKYGVIRVIPKQSATDNPAEPGHFRPKHPAWAKSSPPS